MSSLQRSIRNVIASIEAHPRTSMWCTALFAVAYYLIVALQGLDYADEGFYDGTIFHRVIDGFMVQGGGFTPDLKQKRATHPAIVNEARGGLPNQRGTIAMARTNEPHSATCQWFVNTVDNDFLDAKNARDGWGYTVFGRVIRGMDVIDKISSVKTGTRMGMRDVPTQTVKILSVKIKR